MLFAIRPTVLIAPNRRIVGLLVRARCFRWACPTSEGFAIDWMWIAALSPVNGACGSLLPLERQRRSETEPKVGAQRLPWVEGTNEMSTPTAVGVAVVLARQ